jgi:hypothetical protein
MSHFMVARWLQQLQTSTFSQQYPKTKKDKQEASLQVWFVREENFSQKSPAYFAQCPNSQKLIPIFKSIAIEREQDDHE